MWKKIRPWVLPTTLPSNLELQPGLYHYRRERDGEYVRYHLRVENSGQALLLVAAVEAVRLTRSGAIAAFGFLEGKAETEIIDDLGGLPEATTVIQQVRQMIAELGLPNKRYPIFNLSDPLVGENPEGLIAPFQADVVLGAWETLQRCLHAVWEAGIPHVRLIGLDDSPIGQERIDTLCSAVRLAEDIGMITGVRMRAGDLMQVDPKSGKPVMDRIAEEGLDYVVVPWGIERDWHARLFGDEDYGLLDQVVSRSDHWEIPTVLEAGLTQASAEKFEQGIDTWINRGIEHIEVFALARQIDPKPAAEVPAASEENWWRPFEARHLRQLASWIEDLADDRRVQIVWLPTLGCSNEFSEQAAVRLLRSGPRAGSDISIRIESDGSVLPPRGPHVRIGKIQSDAWDNLWNHPAFSRFREMVNRNEHCSECSMMAICAAHCPADPDGWAIENE
jgi:radical SAM protein with 4Fe4S-binding SPASM domain